jgi:GT2 family glycosyltransferase/tetratricopeptide (TPR) repeat protein
MPCRYLFGPVTPDFAEQNLRGERRADHCLAFNQAGGSDLVIGPGDTWDAVCTCLPPGWQPDFLVLQLAYSTIPECLWSAPVPRVCLAADWNLLWHYYRLRLRDCDLVLTDTAGVEALQREGIGHARAANLFGCERRLVEGPWPDGPRDIDILFVGNLHEAVQRERLPWLGRLARLGERWRVAIHTGVFGEAYWALLARARIVFNWSLRGEANRRAFEAAAAGALLFQEAHNREVSAYFRDRQECVHYTSDNLESLLAYYLEHEDERRAIGQTARARAGHFTYENLWESHRELIEREWPGMAARSRQRGARGEELLTRTWQLLSSSTLGDPQLSADLREALASRPESAALHNALGLAATVQAIGAGPVSPSVAAAAAGHFQRALACDPLHVMAGLNRAEALVVAGQYPQAVEQARQTLGLVNRAAKVEPGVLDAGHFPPEFDHFHVEWERAAWANAGQPLAELRAKRELLRWRLHTVLAELTGDLSHYHEAVVARPDLPLTRAALGCALGRQKRPAEALPHFRRALDANPFDRDLARAFSQALGEAGCDEEQRRLAHDRRLLSQAAPQVVPAESWFAEAPPTGGELASIIVLCHNQVAFTRLCLESVLRHTRPPYELVVVDNGSSDGTPAYLEELRRRPGPVRVVVLTEPNNQGFATGCNQALRHAQGRYLVFLNNDTVVTPDWLRSLIAWSLRDWPRLGLVGPMSNYASGPQLIAEPYAGLDDLEVFAAQRRRAYAGRALDVGRLTGFCLLVRREVLDQVGGFDERFGLGFFEDDDLCVRARAAGFRLLVAQEVFVHHFGSRTFKHLGIDASAQLRENFERLRAKWGPEKTAGYRLSADVDTRPTRIASHDAGSLRAAQAAGPQVNVSAIDEPAAGRPVTTGSPRVSLCLIVKNEEANLPACLSSAADLVDEIIVVDTGSTDGTKEVAARFGAKVHDFPWVDSFAAARNESLRHAGGDWIFWLDADDRLDADNRRKLRVLFAGLGGENAAYSMKCVCLPDPQFGTATIVDHVRLFRRHPHVHWRYRVHEQILPAVRQAGGEVRSTDIHIHHVGYQDGATRHRKQERDLRLLHLDQADHPDDPFTLFNLGWAYEELGRAAQALPLLRRSLERSHPGDSIVRKLYALIGECHRQLGQPAEALKIIQEGRRYYPDDAQLLFQEALRRREQNDSAGAEACLVRLLSSNERPHFASVAEGLRGHLARHQLAGVLLEQGRFAETEAQWRAVLAERPEFAPAWFGLGDIYVRQERWVELEGLSVRLATGGGTARAALAAMLRARGCLARNDFSAARGVLEQALAEQPEEIRLWLALSQALLQEGRDWPAAERVLRRVLELDPGHAEARHNLALLLRQQGRAGDAALQKSSPPVHDTVHPSEAPVSGR